MTDAMERLIEAVEAGEPVSFKQAQTAVGYDQALYATRAHYGSLDAAKALHDALLPGWTFCVGQNAHHGDWNAFVRLAQDGAITREQWGGTDDNAARAWLLAILRAKLAENHPRQKTSD